MKRRIVRDRDSGKLIEDLWIDHNTSDRVLRRALKAPLNVSVVMEVNAEASDWEEAEMGQQDATKYRAIVARLNFLSQDRADLQFPSKECSRFMAKPQHKHWKELKRIGRYLVGKPRVVHMFNWQDEQAVLNVYSDSNWAGCHKTRKSTSGACFMHGGHLIRSYSKTQSVLALSSAEAELYALTSAASEGMGMKLMMMEFGTKMDVMVHVDASAAIGIAQRKGLGKIRHLDVQSLWIQDALRQRRIALVKVPGVENPSDLMTKHQDAQTILKITGKMGLTARGGRAISAPKLATLHVQVCLHTCRNKCTVFCVPMQKSKTPQISSGLQCFPISQHL